jgi:PKD repeat protein
MVWDTKDTSSGWISGPSFSTPNHAYPFIDFRWVPQSPVVDEKVNFIDLSTVFGEATKKDWYWEFQDGTPPHSNKQNPETKFSSVGDKTITLTLTDSYDFTCSDSRTLTIQFPLPEWKEIPPFIPAFLENPILAEIEKGFNEIFSLK